MRLPRTVNICGKKFAVSKDFKSYHSSGGTHVQKMIVGAKGASPERVFESYLHEVLELIACELHIRYTAADDDVVIVMTHKQFDSFAANTATALMPLLNKL